MKNISQIMLFLTAFLLFGGKTLAEDNRPTILPSVLFKYIDDKGESVEKTDQSVTGNAPLEATFYANPSNNEGWSATYEWIITRENGNDREVILDRYLNDEDQTEYTFLESGTYHIDCCATFVNGNDTVRRDKDNTDGYTTMTCTIYESQLEMPNAFAPGVAQSTNNTYKPKKVKSIIEFHATIYSRWGVKLYSWDDVNSDGWDGTYNGRQVKDGVYYCLVHAKGADGRKFTIRKDVNILRGYIEVEAVGQ